MEYTLRQFPNLKIFGHGPVFWSEIGKLETVGQRAVYMSDKGKQFERLPSGPITEEGTVPKLFRMYPNLQGDLSDAFKKYTCERIFRFCPGAAFKGTI